MPETTIVESTMVQRVGAWLVRHGHDPVPLLEAARVPVGLLTGPPVLMPFVDAMRLYDLVARHVGDPVVGLAVAREAQAREYGLVGLIWAHHPTIDAALHALVHYYNLFFPTASLVLRREDGATRIESSWRIDVPGLVAFRPEVITAIYLNARASSAAPWKPRAVSLHGPPVAVEAYTEVFGVSPMFHAAADELVLPDEVLLAPNPHADPLLLQPLLQAAETHLVRRRQAGGARAQTLHLTGCTVDLAVGTVARGPDTDTLTTKERALLEYFAARRNQVVSHADIERDVWGMGRSVISHAPAVAIRRLRSKIEPHPRRPVNLVTVFGEGWRLVVP